jgi:hypothetical protein
MMPSTWKTLCVLVSESIVVTLGRWFQCLLPDVGSSCCFSAMISLAPVATIPRTISCPLIVKKLENVVVIAGPSVDR